MQEEILDVKLLNFYDALRGMKKSNSVFEIWIWAEENWLALF